MTHFLLPFAEFTPARIINTKKSHNAINDLYNCQLVIKTETGSAQEVENPCLLQNAKNIR